MPDIKNLRETQGLWFSGGGLIGQLAQAGLPVGIPSPLIFVPFSQIEYLMVSA